MANGARDAGRRWAAERDFWQRVAEQLGSALAVIDTAGRIVAVNRAAERLLDRTAPDLLGADVHDLLHRDPDGNRIPRERCPLLQALRRGTEAQGDGDAYLRGDGTPTTVAWSASPLADNGVVRGTALLFAASTTAADRGARRERTAYTSALEDLNERLTLVAQITDVLGQTLETEEALGRLGRLLVPRLADWAAVDLLTGIGDEVHRTAVTGPAGRYATQEGWRGPLPPNGSPDLPPPARVLNGGEPVLQGREELAGAGGGAGGAAGAGEALGEAAAAARVAGDAGAARDTRTASGIGTARGTGAASDTATARGTETAGDTAAAEGAETAGDTAAAEDAETVSDSGTGLSLGAVHDGFLRAVGATSALTVPLGAQGQVSGALTLVRTNPAHPFNDGDLKVVSDIGRRVGLVIDNARRFGRQRAVAEAMQRNLLAPLPQPDGMHLAARYQPAPAGSQVGGDWYDAFELKDGALALVIGDVVGHDLTAAGGMAQLHGVLRALAWDHTEPPGVIVDRLDDAMPAITTVSMATLVLARVEGRPDGPWTLRWTSAGHLPPLLLTPDGGAQYLEAGQGLLLGTRLGTDGHRPEAAVPLPPGATLLFYTDGLVEVPGSDLDTGLGRLRRNALAHADEPLDTLCDELLARTPPGSTDDVALLAVRLRADPDDTRP
ncbi:SpoIIE family protein phosphatase [Streptomyces lienomycini]|uniref:SpoIIE family protein phosphatase n=1 Tax=Streptomyces lienomycini TaxID=284035 RepID=A0ABV9WX84_9ACTN|nr:SpoIIE family protein phosphatase [Streptomyces lienomycini]